MTTSNRGVPWLVDHPWPVFEEPIWDHLQEISGITKEFIFKWINLEDIDPLAVSIVHFFTFPKKFNELLPEVYRTYTDIFQQDPLNYL